MYVVAPDHTVAPTQRPPSVNAPISSPLARGVPLIVGLTLAGIPTVALFPVFEVKVK
jgi:hypothetical protein